MAFFCGARRLFPSTDGFFPSRTSHGRLGKVAQTLVALGSDVSDGFFIYFLEKMKKVKCDYVSVYIKVCNEKPSIPSEAARTLQRQRFQRFCDSVHDTS